jgi:hypothetical protein
LLAQRSQRARDVFGEVIFSVIRARPTVLALLLTSSQEGYVVVPLQWSAAHASI